MKFYTNKLIVVSAHYEEQNKYSLVFLKLKRHKGNYCIAESSSAIEHDGAKNEFVILYVTGHGIISKDISVINEEYHNKITTEENEFYWNYSGNGKGKKLNFVRRQQLLELLAELESAKITICEIIYSAEKNPPCDDAILNVATGFVSKSLDIINLIKPGKENSKIAYVLYSKLKFLVLSIVLLTLFINFFARQSVSEKNSIINKQLQNVRNNAGKENNSEQQKRVLFKDFDKNIPQKYSWICDKIASDVPGQLILQNLSVQKQIKSPENNKPPELQKDIINIGGTSHDPSEVSAFMSILQKEPFTKEITLLSVKQDKDQSLFNFIIEIKI